MHLLIFFLVIALGIVALCLFLILLGILVARIISKYKNQRPKSKYKRLAKKYQQRRGCKNGQIIMPKFSTTFPTLPFQMQLDNGISQAESSDSEDPWKTIRYGDASPGTKKSEARKLAVDRRTRYNRRVLSESDLFVMTQQEIDNAKNNFDVAKLRSKSDTKEEAKRKMRRSRSRSALRALAEISGQLEYTVYYDSVKRRMEFKVLQVLEINEITPDLFRDQCQVLELEDVTLSIERPCLIRQKNGRIAFSNMAELGLCVELTMFPRKRHVGTTNYKHEMNSLIFNERFVVEHCSTDCFYGSSLRLQVLLRYGKHKQMPIIIGETLVSLKDITYDVILPFTDYLKLPVDEGELEVRI